MDCGKEGEGGGGIGIGIGMLSGFAPNGLLPNKANSLAKELERERWSRAERRTAELLKQILPTPRSEEQRNAVVSYLRRLIMENAPCEVFIFGSVPLKTYLPDGDIDLTAFSDNKHFKDNLVHEVRDILQREGKNQNAEFHVKEIHHIQAEVTILKCLVGDFVVDISFNQISGLCTLCFLEEVDNLIRQNHLFKRSIILIKAWCFHESRILGAHHGLISSYALETLVLYIFHIYHNITFAGPLEVLFRFLDFFSKFDWKNYCISLHGPVLISSLPIMRVEPPVKDCQKLLLTEEFLHACESYYGVKRRGRENQELPFVPKFMNIVDPLCENNNLGRSINNGNFFRIKSAIAFGAQRIMRLLECQEETLIAEFDFFFRNTWDRHGRGHWIHLTSYNLLSRNNNFENSAHHESGVELAQASQGFDGVSQKPDFHLEESKGMLETSGGSSVSQTRITKTNDIFTGTMTSDIKHTSSSKKNALTDKGKRPMYSSNEGHHVHQFPLLAHCSPELGNLSSEVPPQHKQSGVSERKSGQIHSASLKIDDSRRASSRSEVLDKNNIRASAENQHSSGKSLHDWKSEDAVDSKNVHSCEFGSGENNQIGISVDEYIAPFNVYSCKKPFPPPPPPGFESVFKHANSFGVPPVNVPSLESSWGHNMPNSQGLLPLPASVSMTLNQEKVDYNVVAGHLDHENSSEGFWSEKDIDGGSRSCNSSWWTSLGSYFPKDYWETTKHKTRKSGSDDPPDKKTKDGDVNSPAISRNKPALPSTSRTKPSSSSLSPSLTSQPLDTDLAQSKTKTVTSDVKAHQSACFMPPVGSSSPKPYAPALLVGPSPSQIAVDNKGVSSFAFGPSRPQFPPTGFPFFDLPTETGFPYTPFNHMNMDAAELGNLQAWMSSFSLDSTEKSRQSNGLLMANNIRHNATLEPCVKQRSDILRADFMCHWTDLQYARLCENSQVQVPWPYPSSFVPPWYPTLPEQVPWQVPMRPPDLMNNLVYGPALFPMMPNQHAYGFDPFFNQHYSDLAFRYRCGTGTFLPEPISYQSRYFRRKCYYYDKYEKENYRFERKDNDGGREDNWNYNSTERFGSRGQFQFGDFIDRMNRTNQGSRRRKRNYHKNASTSNNNSAATVKNEVDPPLVISTDTNEASHQGESSHSASNEVSLVLLVNISDTNEASQQGESSHSASDEVENVEREAADPSPQQPSTPNSPGVQD